MVSRPALRVCLWLQEKAVVAAGSWASDFFDPGDYTAAGLGVTRQVVYWFEVADLEQWSDFPFLIWAGHDISDYLGAFPIPPNGTPALKVMVRFHAIFPALLGDIR